MAKKKGKKKSAHRKSPKRAKAGKKIYHGKKGGLKSYINSPKHAAKRSRAAKKAAATRARNKGKGYAKKKGKGKKRKVKSQGRHHKYYRRLPKDEARAARIARKIHRAKTRRPVAVAPVLSGHQASYMQRLRERAAAARASIPSYWAS